MYNDRKNRGRLGQRGQSMVEFALTVPLLLLLLFGIIDFGRAVFYQNELTNGAREGARVAVLASNPCNTELGSNGAACGGQTLTGTTVCDAIRNEGTLVGTWSCTDTGTIPAVGVANNAYVQVTSGPDCPTATNTFTPRAGGNRSTKVQIVYYYRPLTPGLTSFFPSTFTLKSTACGRAEF
jgi:Flp pilus assembly protein TadG